MQSNRLKAVILTSNPTEYEAARSYLTELEEITHPQGTVYEHGAFSAQNTFWDIFIGEIGQRNTESALEAERAIGYFRPDLILFIGLARGFRETQIGDVIAVTKVYGYENGKSGESFQARPEVGQSTYRMINRARAERRNANWQRRVPWITTGYQAPNVFVGSIAAGEKEITVASDIWQLLENHYNDAMAMDTASYGFLAAAHANSSIEALIVRGIASTLYTDGSAFSEKRAAYHASAFAFEVLSKLDKVTFYQQEVSSPNALALLEHLAQGTTLSTHYNNASITLYTATSVEMNKEVPLSDSAKEAQEWLDKGNIYFQNQQYRDAVSAYNKALRRNRKHPMIYNNKGAALFHQKKYAEALKSYNNAIECNPKYSDAYNNKAKAHYSLGEYAEALISYQHAIDLYNHEIPEKPNNEVKELQKHLASAHTGLGDTFCRLGRYSEALTNYNRAIKLVPTKASAYIGRGECYIQQKRFEYARADYNRAIKYDPNNLSAHRGKGHALKGLGQLKEAIEAYDHALLLNPDDADTHYAKGITWLLLQDYHHALEAFKAFQSLDPENILGYKCIIATLGELHQYEEILTICDKAWQIAPNDTQISNYKRKALLELERCQQDVEKHDTVILAALKAHNVKK